MRKDVILLNKDTISVSTGNGFVSLRNALCSDKCKTATVVGSLPKWLLSGVIRKIRDLFFPTTGPSCHMDVKKYVRTAKNRNYLRRDKIFLTPC